MLPAQGSVDHWEFAFNSILTPVSRWCSRWKQLYFDHSSFLLKDLPDQLLCYSKHILSLLSISPPSGFFPVVLPSQLTGDSHQPMKNVKNSWHHDGEKWPHPTQSGRWWMKTRLQGPLQTGLTDSKSSDWKTKLSVTQRRQQRGKAAAFSDRSSIKTDLKVICCQANRG